MSVAAVGGLAHRADCLGAALEWTADHTLELNELERAFLDRSRAAAEAETLRQRRCVLRVRVESGKSLLTFKGPVQPSPMKLREEIETVVGDGETMLRCLEALGYNVWFRYQKYREEFALNDVVIAIDETPVGVFVEVEGGEQGILEVTRAMGLTEADFVLDSYRALFMEHRRAHGLPATDMLFEE